MESDNGNCNSVISNDSILKTSSVEEEQINEDELMIKYYSRKFSNLEGSLINNFNNRLKFGSNDSENFSFTNNPYSNTKIIGNSFSAGDVNNVKSFNQLMNKNLYNLNLTTVERNNDMINTQTYFNDEINEMNKSSFIKDLPEGISSDIAEFINELTTELDSMFKILNKFVEGNMLKSKKIKYLKNKTLQIYERYNTMKLDFTSRMEEKERFLAIYEEAIDCLDNEKNQLIAKIDQLERNIDLNQGLFVDDQFNAHKNENRECKIKLTEELNEKIKILEEIHLQNLKEIEEFRIKINSLTDLIRKKENDINHSKMENDCIIREINKLNLINNDLKNKRDLLDLQLKKRENRVKELEEENEKFIQNVKLNNNIYGLRKYAKNIIKSEPYLSTFNKNKLLNKLKIENKMDSIENENNNSNVDSIANLNYINSSFEKSDNSQINKKRKLSFDKPVSSVDLIKNMLGSSNKETKENDGKKIRKKFQSQINLNDIYKLSENSLKLTNKKDRLFSPTDKNIDLSFQSKKIIVMEEKKESNLAEILGMENSFYSSKSKENNENIDDKTNIMTNLANNQSKNMDNLFQNTDEDYKYRNSKDSRNSLSPIRRTSEIMKEPNSQINSNFCDQFDILDTNYNKTKVFNLMDKFDSSRNSSFMNKSFNSNRKIFNNGYSCLDSFKEFEEKNYNEDNQNSNNINRDGKNLINNIFNININKTYEKKDSIKNGKEYFNIDNNKVDLNNIYTKKIYFDFVFDKIRKSHIRKVKKNIHLNKEKLLNKFNEECKNGIWEEANKKRIKAEKYEEFINKQVDIKKIKKPQYFKTFSKNYRVIQIVGKNYKFSQKKPELNQYKNIWNTLSEQTPNRNLVKIISNLILTNKISTIKSNENSGDYSKHNAEKGLDLKEKIKTESNNKIKLFEKILSKKKNNLNKENQNEHKQNDSAEKNNFSFANSILNNKLQDNVKIPENSDSEAKNLSILKSDKDSIIEKTKNKFNIFSLLAKKNKEEKVTFEDPSSKDLSDNSETRIFAINENVDEKFSKETEKDIRELIFKDGQDKEKENEPKSSLFTIMNSRSARNSKKDEKFKNIFANIVKINQKRNSNNADTLNKRDNEKYLKEINDIYNKKENINKKFINLFKTGLIEKGKILDSSKNSEVNRKNTIEASTQTIMEFDNLALFSEKSKKFQELENKIDNLNMTNFEILLTNESTCKKLSISTNFISMIANQTNFENRRKFVELSETTIYFEITNRPYENKETKINRKNLSGGNSATSIKSVRKKSRSSFSYDDVANWMKENSTQLENNPLVAMNQQELYYMMYKMKFYGYYEKLKYKVLLNNLKKRNFKKVAQKSKNQDSENEGKQIKREKSNSRIKNRRNVNSNKFEKNADNRQNLKNDEEYNLTNNEKIIESEYFKIKSQKIQYDEDEYQMNNNVMPFSVYQKMNRLNNYMAWKNSFFLRNASNLLNNKFIPFNHKSQGSYMFSKYTSQNFKRGDNMKNSTFL